MSVYAGPNNNVMLPITTINPNGLVVNQLQLYYDLTRDFTYSGTGSVIKDLSGNGRDATMYNAGGSTYSLNPAGAPTFIKNRSGEFTFDGNDFGKFSQISAGSNITVSVWCKTTNSDRENGIVSHCSGGPVGIVYQIFANKMQYKYYDAMWSSVSSTATVNDGNWKNLVWAKSGSSLEMYINGVQDSVHTLTRDQTSLLVSFGSGWGPCNSDSYGAGTDGYSQCFIGSIGMLMIHSTQLTSAQINVNYNATRSRYGI